MKKLSMLSIAAIILFAACGKEEISKEDMDDISGDRTFYYSSTGEREGFYRYSAVELDADYEKTTIIETRELARGDCAYIRCIQE